MTTSAPTLTPALGEVRITPAPAGQSAPVLTVRQGTPSVVMAQQQKGKVPIAPLGQTQYRVRS